MNDSKQVKRLEPETREVFMDPTKWHQLDSLGGLKRDRLDNYFRIVIENHDPYLMVKIYRPGIEIPAYCNPHPPITQFEDAKNYAYEQYCIQLSQFEPEDIGPASVSFGFFE